MNETTEKPTKRVDEYVEIPLFYEDGTRYSRTTLKFRPGHADDRIQLDLGTVTYEVKSIALKQALRLLEEGDEPVPASQEES